MSDLTTNLNDTIVSAVKAQISASVLEALSGDQAFARMIETALSRPVKVPKKQGYGDDMIPYVNHVLEETVRSATHDAVKQLVTEMEPQLRDAVKKALRRNLDPIADSMVGKVSEAVGRTYGIKVDMHLQWPSD